MDYYLEELYQKCAEELRVLYRLAEQDQEELSGCFGGEVLKASQKNAELLYRQLDSIKKDLVTIQYGI